MNNGHTLQANDITATLKRNGYSVWAEDFNGGIYMESENMQDIAVAKRFFSFYFKAMDMEVTEDSDSDTGMVFSVRAELKR